MGTFGKVAPAVPAVAIASAVVFVGARLASAAYSRWQARILNAPYTPELFPARVVDAAVAVSIIRSSPIFAEKFKAELEAGNLKLLRDTVREALQDNSEAALWKREDIAARFHTMDELRTGIDEIQRLAITGEVTKDVEPEQLTAVGGMDNFLRAIDQINADEKAQADLDQIMLVVNQLRKNGQPVEEIFRESIDELQAEAAT